MNVNCLKKFFVPFDVNKFIDGAAGCPDDPKTVTELWKMVEPAVYWRESFIESINKGKLTTTDGFVIESQYVCEGFKGCTRLAIMAVTAGKKISNASQALMKDGRLYDGAIADMLGSFAAEAAADSFCEYMRTRSVAKRLFPTLRFSPGYGDWNIAAQKKILNYLDDCAGEITLNEGGMLLPEKTITAAVGFLTNLPSEQYPVGERTSGFCAGDKKCSECTTWECRK